MKRLKWVLALALLAAGAAHAWYYHTHRPVAAYEAEIRWLAAELNLTGQQVEQVRAVHQRLCPSMNDLHVELQQQRAAAPNACQEVENRCAQTTERLIAAVSEVLTPSQREHYLHLVKPCLNPATRD